MKPLITVIIPVYNNEKYLRRAVESVCNQTYPHELMEIFIVDDGSTDSTPAVCDTLKEEYTPRIKVFHREKNEGLSSARNFGIRNAGGEYISFVDSDDYIAENMLEKLQSAAHRFNAEIVQGSRNEIAEDGSQMPDICAAPEREIAVDSKSFLKSLLMHTGDVSFCTKLIKRSVFHDGNFFPVGELNEDFYLLIRILKDIESVVILPDRLYNVFYMSGSISRVKKGDTDYFPPVFRDIVINADRALLFVEENFPDLREAALRFCLYQRLDYLLHIPVSKMTGNDKFYSDVVRYVRKSFFEIISNKYLSFKDKRNLLILSINPKLVRSLHSKLKKKNI